MQWDIILIRFRDIKAYKVIFNLIDYDVSLIISPLGKQKNSSIYVIV